MWQCFSQPMLAFYYVTLFVQYRRMKRVQSLRMSMPLSYQLWLSETDVSHKALGRRTLAMVSIKVLWNVESLRPRMPCSSLL
jgi:hypothetical protein